MSVYETLAGPTRSWGADGSRVYLPGYEHRTDTGETKVYVGDYAVITRTGTTRKVDYLLKDRLGSVDAVANAVGSITDARGYDPFGKPRDGTWADRTPATLTSRLTTPKGFTQHEHLDALELIHMNGRVFEYHMGRFTGVDPFIQFPLNSQSLNPYSYILNNPLSGTDPTGYRSQSSICDVGVKDNNANGCFSIQIDPGGREAFQTERDRQQRIKREAAEASTTSNGASEYIEGRQRAASSVDLEGPPRRALNLNRTDRDAANSYKPKHLLFVNQDGKQYSWESYTEEEKYLLMLADMAIEESLRRNSAVIADPKAADADREKARRIADAYALSGGVWVFQDVKDKNGVSVTAIVSWGDLTSGDGPERPDIKPRVKLSVRELRRAYEYGLPRSGSYLFGINSGPTGFIHLFAHEFGHLDKYSMVARNETGWEEISEGRREGLADGWRRTLMQGKYDP